VHTPRQVLERGADKSRDVGLRLSSLRALATVASAPGGAPGMRRRAADFVTEQLMELLGRAAAVEHGGADKPRKSRRSAVFHFGFLTPNPETRKPKPENRKPEPETRNPKPETRNPKPEARNPQPETRNPEPGTRNTKHETRNPQPETRHPQPETRNLKPEPDT
ncbi:hypothetical protein T484DRAFT_2302140, partial [Baffinella frigidus]